MADTYSFTISADTVNGIVATRELEEEIDASSIDTVANPIIDVAIDVKADLLEIIFTSALSAGDQTTLTGVVNAHTGEWGNVRIRKSSVTQYQGDIDHDALTNFVANEHVDHSGVSITGGVGLSGGGDITANRSIDLDVNSLTTDATPDKAADFVATYDASAGGHKKVLIENLFTDGNSAYADYYHNTAHAITTTAGTLAFNTTRISHADFTLTANELTINKAGDYRVDIDVSLDRDDSNKAGVDVWLEKNSVEIAGTRARLYHADLDEETAAHVGVTLTLVATDVIRARGQVIKGTGNTNTRANSLRLSIATIGATGPQGPQGVPGSGTTLNLQEGGVPVTNTPHDALNFNASHFDVTDNGDGSATVAIAAGITGSHYAESEGESTTTSTTYQQKLRLSFTAVAGNYMIWWSCELDDSDSNERITVVKVEVDDTTIVNESEQDDSFGEGNAVGYLPFSGFRRLNLAAGTRNIDLDYRVVPGESGTAKIRRARLFAVRVV